jgi:hypothetical protein
MNTLRTVAYDDNGDPAHFGAVLAMARRRRRSSVNQIDEKLKYAKNAKIRAIQTRHDLMRSFRVVGYCRNSNSILADTFSIARMVSTAALSVPRCFRLNRNAARVVWILACTPPIAMCGRGGCDVRVLQVQQKSQIVAPLLHLKSLIINICSTVAGGGGAEAQSLQPCATLFRSNRQFQFGPKKACNESLFR